MGFPLGHGPFSVYTHLSTALCFKHVCLWLLVRLQASALSQNGYGPCCGNGDGHEHGCFDALTISLWVRRRPHSRGVGFRLSVFCCVLMSWRDVQHVYPPAHTRSLRDLVAGVRAYIQIALLGFILKPNFATDFPSLAMCYVSVLGVRFCVRGCGEPKNSFSQHVLKLCCQCCCLRVFTICAPWAVVAPQPWYCPQNMIPTAGMLINKLLRASLPL